MVMTIKIAFKEVGDLVEICKFAGVAPCQVLCLNKARSEEELVGREIFVNMSVASLARDVGRVFTIQNGEVLASG